MESYDEELKVLISWDIDDPVVGTHYLGSHPYMMVTDSNTATPTEYKTYNDTVTYTSTPEGESGTLVIEKITDKAIKGVFNFVAEVWNSTQSITVDGDFNIPREE